MRKLLNPIGCSVLFKIQLIQLQIKKILVTFGMMMIIIMEKTSNSIHNTEKNGKEKNMNSFANPIIHARVGTYMLDFLKYSKKNYYIWFNLNNTYDSIYRSNE